MLVGQLKIQQLNVTGVSTFNDHIIATSKFTIGDVDSIAGGAPIDRGVIVFMERVETCSPYKQMIIHKIVV